MTTAINTAPAVAAPTESAQTAAEIRAIAARRGIRHRAIADAVGVSEMYLSRRIAVRASQHLTLEEVAGIAEALGVPVTDLMPWLPRLDSNQQPSGYPLALVRTAA